MGSLSLPWPFRKGRTGSKDQRSRADQDDDVQEFGLTEQLLDYVKGFTVDTFKDYPLQDDQRALHPIPVDGSGINVSKDLTEWQERHATLVLSKAKELSQLRFVLCPRHLKEQQFWRIYFLLVKSYVSTDEIRALTKAKLRMIELQNEKSVDKASIEVEMTDTKHTSHLSMTLQCGSKLIVDGDRGADEGGR